MKLALGTVQFGTEYGIANQHGIIPFSDVKEILSYSSDNGIHTLDTAVAYGNAEEILGKIGVNDWELITKLPAVPQECEDIKTWARSSILDSISKLNTDKLFGLLLHKPEMLFSEQGKELYQTLLDLKQQKFINKIGVSVYDPSELHTLLDNFDIDIVQAPFNIFDHRLVTSGWLNSLSSMGIEVHVRSVFLQGLLLMNSEQRPDKFKLWEKNWQLYERWLKKYKLTALQACLGFVTAYSEINKIIIGVDSLKHLKEIISAYNTKIDTESIDFNSEDINLLNPSKW